MPNRDGTGPTGAGPLTGRGLGPCNTTNKRPLGRGRGLGRGLNRPQFKNRRPSDK